MTARSVTKKKPKPKPKPRRAKRIRSRPTALQYLNARAVLDPLWWLKRYTPAAVPARYAWFHSPLSTIPPPGVSQVRAVFRGAAKTTIVRGTCLHAAIHHRARGILLIRATFADAKADREAIERNAQLAGVEAVNDGDKKMVLVGDVPIWTRTPGGAVRGIHWVNPKTGEVIRPNLTVIDDLETRDSARSTEQTKKISVWLFSDALSTADQSFPMSTIFLGTPITPTSLVAQAMRKQAPFDAWADPLIVPLERPDGKPNWPDSHDPTLRGKIPALTMATEYDLDPLPPGTLLFPPRLTNWRALPPSATHELVVSIDPAGDGEDATAAVAMCMTPRGLHVPDVLHHEGASKLAPAAIARFVKRLLDAGWVVRGITFEGVGGWVFMKREVSRELAALEVFVRVTSDVPSDDKVTRALPLTVWHAAGAFSADPKLKGSAWDQEFHSFDNDGQTITGHDDTVDASAWAGGPLTRGWRDDPPDLPGAPVE